MQSYDPKRIEPKWQKKWESQKIYRASDTGVSSGKKKKKYYALVEFPFPSGDGLHVGHVRSYVAMDIVSRKRRMEGYNVLYPIGWDAFGLPTENYAIKTGIHPAKVTKQNTDNFRRQLKALGLSFDWSREINTSEPEYYKWTQCIFLQLYKHGLAYKAKTEINWCPSCKIGLANEEVVDEKCERCDSFTEKRDKEQWMLAITKYADRLLADLDNVDYSENIKTQQRNWIGKSEGGSSTNEYKLRDWVFSRQRYWGEPIPMIHCAKCGWVPVSEKDLPVKLPTVKNYQPTDTGESPLANIHSWVKTKCPVCKSPAKRETDVMPNWAGSSWYFLRYIDPKNKRALADKNKLEYWMKNEKDKDSGVDWYNGGMEHTTLHLLYSRFWNKFLYDIGAVPVSEPYRKRTSHGLILAEGGVKMSKSKGNVVNPNAIVSEYGADTMRVYEMFMGPFDQAIAWDEKSIIGSRRFLDRVWRLVSKVGSKKIKARSIEDLERVLHKTIKKVSEDIENMHFNTAISQMMVFINEIEKEEVVPRKIFETFLILIAPFAPHIAEEIWTNLGHKKSIHIEHWPKWNEERLRVETLKIAVQVNGKVRATIEVSDEADEKEIKSKALADESVRKWLGGGYREPKNVIYIQGRIVSIVV